VEAESSLGERSPVPRIIEVDPHEDPRWAEFVSSHPDALVYHHPAWLDVLQRTYGYPVVALAYLDPEDSFLGILPLCRKRGLLSGRRLSSLPHTPVAGPLACDTSIAAALIREAIARTTAVRGMRLQIKHPTPEFDGIANGLKAVPWSDAYVIEFPNEPGPIRFGNSRNHARVKWAVNKAIKAGVTVRTAEDEEDVRRWHALYLRTMKERAVPPYPLEFFSTAFATLAPQKLMLLLLAEQGSDRNRLLSGSVFFMHARTIFWAFSALRRDATHLRPSELIQWEAIHTAREAGFRRYELGTGDAQGEGLAAYKRKWGASSVVRFRYYFPFDGSNRRPRRRRELYRPETDLQHRALAAVWRRLPLAATAVLGRWLYRYA
jgi:hypothetical protein